jgi:two-component system, cell cycle sensor histidine kinase and response regulator CckA
MQKRPNLTPGAAERRSHAERLLREQHHEATLARTEADAQRLVHELQVHQIELQMQNTELQQTRDELEAALGKYSDLYDFAPVGYLTLDREGTIQEANLTVANLLGIERSRLLNRNFELHLSTADLPVFTAFLTKLFESKAKEFCEVKLLKEGVHPVEVRIEAAVAASGCECRAALTDITEQKRAEESRLILSKLESTGILAGGIAHDFNNLLTIILGNIELAQLLLPPGEKAANLLEQAKQASLTSKRLTRRLVTFATGGTLVREPTRLAELIQESACLAVSGSCTQCDFSLAEDLYLVEVDAGQIGQVIQNLVINAQEAMQRGGVVSLQAENVILGPHDNPSLPPGNYVRVNIADQGVGMSKEVLSKIFDPYFSTKQKPNQRGMGLGLTICHTVIQNHRGAIAVESEPGVGTTVHLYIPASRKSLQKEKTSVPAIIPLHGRILVMDDEEEVRKLVGMSLQRMGHDVALVADGEQAIEVYRSAKNQGRPFDAVILDLTVRAGIGGQEAIQALLQIDPAVNAIVMSGYSIDPVLTEPQRYGFKGVLAKPFDTAKLREILSSVMEK